MSLGKLVCGVSGETCQASATLDHLSASIDRFSEKAVGYLSGPMHDEAQSFGAFCARVTLENACAALLGRLDPFRMLYLAEFQAQGAYEYGKPTKSGFKWTGDVFAEDKPLASLWSSDHDVSKVSRALFSPHVEAVHWQPAFNSAIDYVDTQDLTGFEELKQLEASSFISATKADVGLYIPNYRKAYTGTFLFLR